MQGVTGAGDGPQPELLSPAPAQVPQGFSAGPPQIATPATAPRAANPTAFLRNTNSVFSPDMPADSGVYCHIVLLFVLERFSYNSSGL